MVVYYKIIEKEPNELDILFRGEIRTHTEVDDFQKALDELLEKKSGKINFNFNEVTHFCSAAVGKFLKYSKIFKQNNREVAITAISDEIYELFQFIRLDKVINIKQ